MRILLYIISLFFLSACTLYQAPKAPEIQPPQQFKVSIKDVNKNLDNKWWKNFNNLQLNALVDLGLKNSYNYQIAIKNIEIAQTYVSQNKSYLFPQVNGAVATSRNKVTQSEFFGAISNPNSGVNINPNQPAAPLASNTANTSATPASGVSGLSSSPFNVAILSASATYEIDVWNQIRNTVNQAQADTMTNISNSNVVKLTLISSIVNTYFQIMALDSNIHNLNKQYKAAKEITELTTVQFKSGLINASNVYTAKTQEEQILANIKLLEKQRQIFEYTLAYLVSEYPENFSIKPQGNLNKLRLTQLIPPGIPSSMLGMRPDIQSAYSQVMSYGYIEKQTIANFLPTFNLTGNYGYANNTFSSLLQSSNVFWSYGLGITQNIFDYAVRRSEYKRAKYQFESSILSYKDTVINAFTEVNSSLISYQEDNEALNAIKAQYKDSRELLALADAQYKAGLTNYPTYLTSDLNLLQTEYNVTNQQLLVVQDIIQVYKTLGLGL